MFVLLPKHSFVVNIAKLWTTSRPVPILLALTINVVFTRQGPQCRASFGLNHSVHTIIVQFR